MNDKSDTKKCIQQLNISRQLRVGIKLANITALTNRNDHDKTEKAKLPRLGIAYHISNGILNYYLSLDLNKELNNQTTHHMHQTRTKYQT